MKTKLSITKKQEMEVELELPYYFKLQYGTSGSVYYAIFSESKSIRILQDEEISVMSASIAYDNLYSERFAESTKEEFENEFKTTTNNLLTLLNS